MKIMAEVTVEMCDDDDNTDEDIEDGHNVCQLLEEEGGTRSSTLSASILPKLTSSPNLVIEIGVSALLAFSIGSFLLYLQTVTTATTILALIPVLTSTGRGSDIMVPMAIPSFGGMVIAIMTMFVVPVLYCAAMEWKLKLGIKDEKFAENA